MKEKKINTIDVGKKRMMEIDLQEALGSYIKCLDCNYIVINDPEYGDIHKPCPKCGTQHKARGIFPNIKAEQLLLDKIFKAYCECEYELTVILFCLIFEILMEDFLKDFMKNINTPKEIIQLVFDKYGSISSRVDELFKKLTSKSFKEATQSTECKGFYEKWNRVRIIRNKFIHGYTVDVASTTAKEAFELAKSSILLFASLNNNWCIKNQSSFT